MISRADITYYLIFQEAGDNEGKQDAASSDSESELPGDSPLYSKSGSGMKIPSDITPSMSLASVATAGLHDSRLSGAQFQLSILKLKKMRK